MRRSLKRSVGNRFGKMQHRLLGCVGGNETIEAYALSVAQRVNVSVTMPYFGRKTGGVLGGNGVVLNDEVIPVGDPQLAVWTHFHMHRRPPFVRAGNR